MYITDYALPIGVILFCGLDTLLTKSDQRRALSRKWPLHGGVSLAGQLAMFLIPITGVSAASAGAALGFEVGPAIRSYGWPAELVVWLLALTLMTYVLHYAEHRFRLLWAFHRVHHCDEEMESSTALRHHPLEAIYSVLGIAGIAFVLTPSLTTMLTAFLFTLTVDLFNHSRIQLPDGLSTALEWVIVTPRIHRVHHSDYAPQTDSNFGVTFTFWDRLFGTYRYEVPERIGLDDPALSGGHARDFDKLIFEPFKFLWRSRKRN